MQLINVGYGNIVCASRVLAVVSNDSAPMKRYIQDAKDGGTAIDATCGRKTRSVLIMDSGHAVLSAIQPETVAARLSEKEDAMLLKNMKAK